MKTLMMVLAFVLSLTVQADVEVRRDDAARRNPADQRDAELIQLYFSLTDLPLEDQRDQTWGMASKTKAALWTYNIERYLRDHPEMSSEAQEVLREGIRLVTTPAWFDIEPGSFGYEPKTNALAALKQRATSALAPEIIIEVFIRLGHEPEGVTETPVIEETSGDFAPATNAFSCTCASVFDCGSSASYDCFSSWCFTVYHCGWYSNEACTGKCKETGQ